MCPDLGYFPGLRLKGLKKVTKNREPPEKKPEASPLQVTPTVCLRIGHALVISHYQLVS
jgi:hypothetical protein